MEVQPAIIQLFMNVKRKTEVKISLHTGGSRSRVPPRQKKTSFPFLLVLNYLLNPLRRINIVYFFFSKCQEKKIVD